MEEHEECPGHLHHRVVVDEEWSDDFTGWFGNEEAAGTKDGTQPPPLPPAGS